MIFNFEDKGSDSPYVEAVWKNHCESGGPFISMATNQWGIVVTKLGARQYVTIRGPETFATIAECPPEAEHYGIYFKVGTFLLDLRAADVRDGAVNLPEGRHGTFRFKGSAWEIPSYENVDAFVARLVREGLLVRESVVDTTLQGGRIDLSVRSVERRFVQATGLTRSAIKQIERARLATGLLKSGRSILDTVFDAGYADQPHLTRSLKHYIGQTPAQLLNPSRPTQLSFLFKTQRFS